MKEKILILIFLAMLVIPAILYIPLATQSDVSESEKRELAPMPSLSLDTIETFPTEFEAFFDDHLPWRSDIIQLNTSIDLLVFDTVDNPKVIRGKNDWLFYKNALDLSPLDSYIKGSLFTPEELGQITDILTKINDIAEKNDVQFVLVMIPDKERVYADYLPSAFSKASDYRAYSQLYSHLTQYSDITIVDLEPTLQEGRTYYPTYFQTDTHITRYGGYLGTQEILAAIGEQTVPPENLLIHLNESPHTGDLVTLASLSPDLIYEYPPVVENYPENAQVTEAQYKNISAPEVKIESNLNDGKKMLFYGDSFRLYLMPFLSQHFGESIYYSNRITEEELTDVIAREEPDIIVLEYVERYLPFLLSLDTP